MRTGVAGKYASYLKLNLEVAKKLNLKNLRANEDLPTSLRLMEGCEYDVELAPLRDNTTITQIKHHNGK
ncbi:hypothetical protein EPI10_015354 [Gossypium australe]|uniref:Uncharacterized protein n=1 Tax=Gossypium australe TaxID=47621 RepID=A0A5B6VKB0_9ROSI|nr:hypothetical protein EPI10_015354 [Gossypium australe]